MQIAGLEGTSMRAQVALIGFSVCISAAIASTGCAARGTRSSYVSAQHHNAPSDGQASYYADRYHGRTTASGETFDVDALTAAHKSLAFGTVVRVTNLNNGKSVTVRINDRGPYVDGRVIDLSPAAARKIDMIHDGVVPVKLHVLREGTARAD
jgi:rare lipoprotein A